MKYRKKLVEVEARRVTERNQRDVARWIRRGGGETDGFCGKPDCQLCALRIRTLEGLMLVRPGDYVIRGVAGEFYACRGDIFKATYEPLAASQPTGGTEK